MVTAPRALRRRDVFHGGIFLTQGVKERFPCVALSGMRWAVSVDPRDEIIAELQRQLAERDAIIAQLRAEIADLKEKLGKSSRNSSKPPSSDSPGTGRAKKRSHRKPSGKKRGAQPGHPKHGRPLVPESELDEIHDIKPTECESCGRRLHGTDSEPERHQVTDIPMPKPTTEEYRLHALGCACGHVTRAKLPDGVPTGAFGPGIVARVGLVMGAYRLSKRLTVDLLRDLLGLRISVGSIIRCQNDATAALRPCVAEAAEHVKTAEQKHADETSWRVAGVRAWLWVVVTPIVTLFAIHSKRSAESARATLGAGVGALISDRFSGYSWWPLERRQLCWAHLIRDFVAIQERGGASGRIGKRLGEEAERLFSWYHQVRDGTLAWSSFRVYVRPLKKRVRELLEQGTRLRSQPKTAKTCAKMLRVFPAFWYFVDHPDIEPTNNTAEQEIRHGVLFRKTSQGTQSDRGSEFVATILTVRATLRKQERNILDFIIEACRARLNGRKPPSLLRPDRCATPPAQTLAEAA